MGPLNSIRDNWRNCSVLHIVSYFKVIGKKHDFKEFPDDSLYFSIMSMQTFTSSAKTYTGQKLQKDVQILWTTGIQPYPILLEIMKLSVGSWKCLGCESIWTSYHVSRWYLTCITISHTLQREAKWPSRANETVFYFPSTLVSLLVFKVIFSWVF